MRKKPLQSKRIAESNLEKSSETVFEEGNSPSQFVTVYTDGVCVGNGIPLARAGIGAYFTDQETLNISRPVISRQTTNVAEIQAVIAAAQQVRQAGVKKLPIHTDSKFLLKSVQQLIVVWNERGWVISRGKHIANKAGFEKLEETLKSFEEICWQYVPVQSGMLGNEQADQLAKHGSPERNSEADLSKEPQLEYTPVEKRCQGRPRKEPQLEDPLAMKRCRGRPRKEPLVENPPVEIRHWGRSPKKTLDAEYTRKKIDLDSTLEHLSPERR